MSLGLLAIMVVLGLAVVIGAVHFSGASRPFRLTGQEQAHDALSADFPEETPTGCILSEDGTSAFVTLASGAIVLVSAFGARSLTRVLDASMLSRIDPRGERELLVQLRDFTLPGGIYRFGSAADRDHVAARLRQARGEESIHG